MSNYNYGYEMPEVFSAKNDVVFKMLFVRNVDALQSFLSAALDIPLDEIKDIVIKNPELPPEVYDGKLSRLDILLKTGDRNINVELQIERDDTYRERVLFYWSKMFTSPLEKGETYDQLDQSISINVLGFNMFDCKEYHSEFYVLEKNRHELLSDKLAIHFFELNKVKCSADTEDMQKLWLRLINADTKEDFDMLRESNVPIIQKSVNAICELSKDEKLRAYMWEREKAERDHASAMRQAEKRGIAKGKEEVIAELIAGGMPESEIKRILHL
ncbi:MAG: Rpn family recombination-promoting nuclease/putative transposase [Ruminococcus sp.]|nr:Rpn family recombination-promoting nuclease/putative transposase [Ruminococcus sp.]